MNNPKLLVKFPSPSHIFRLAGVASLVLIGTLYCQGQVTASYSPSAWVNDPYTPNPGFTINNPGTSYPAYVNSANIDYNQNLYGYSPIGAKITLAKPGDTVTMTGVCTLAGNVNYANLQFRFGVLYKGTSANDEGWGGALIGLPNTGAQSGIYLEKFVSSAIFSTGASANTIGNYASFTGGAQNGAIQYTLSVTYLTSTSSLVCWTAQGLNGNAFLYYGRYTNTSLGSVVGTNFDTVGFLKGGSVFSANSTANSIAFTNVVVTFGSFGDGTWAGDFSGNWSATNNWVNGNPANGSGFIADFSQASLSASRTVTLDTSRNVGMVVFGDASGNSNSWILNSSGGSTLSLNNNGVPIVPLVEAMNDTATINCAIASTNGLATAGAGVVVLAGNNSISGPLNLNGGVLSFSGLANLPLSSTGISSVVFGGGTLQWAPGNTVDISAQGASFSFAGNAGLDTGANNVTLADPIGDNGPGSLTKLGSGTLTFDGPAAYGGATKINNGVLALGPSGSISSSTNVIVMSNATLDVSAVSGGFSLYQGLSGAGTVNGSVTAPSGANLGAGYAATGAAGTLTVNGNLDLSGSSLTLGLSSTSSAVGGGTNDLIAVTGNLDISGSTTLNVQLINGAPGLGAYTICTYGTFSGSTANIIPPLGYLVTNNAAAQAIQLVVTHVPVSLVWAGDGTQNLWDVDNTPNWLSSGSPADFFTGDTVTFTDTGSDNPYLNIDVPVAPSAVIVSNTESYDFAGSGAIVTGSLMKKGSGLLMLENNNTYPGPTVISNGTLQVGGLVNGGNSGTLGLGPITNQGTLLFDLSTTYTVATNIYGSGSISNIGGSGALTLAGNIQGSGLQMAGFGDMILSGSNSYTGPTIVYSGVLHPRSTYALASTTASAVVSNGAQIYLDANINLPANKPLNLAGTGTGANGALRKGGAGVSYVGGLITLAGNTQFQVDGNSTLYLTNAAGINAPGTSVFLGADANGAGFISGPLTLGAGVLTSQDAGTWTIAPTNNYTGGTVLNGGTLEITSGAALGSAASANPAFVNFNGGTLGVSNNITFNDGLRGFTISGTGEIDVAAGSTFVMANLITGSGTLTKSDSGTLVLSGTNSFNGTFYVDSANNVNNDGVVVVTTSAALANAATPIALRNTLGGSSTFELNGTTGNILLTQDFTMAGRSPKTPGILNAAGTNTISGNLTNSGNGNFVIESDAGVLTLGQAGKYLTTSGTDPITVTLQGAGGISVLDTIADGTNGGDVPISLAVSGNVTLSAANTYSGTTAVSGGNLQVNGAIGTGAVNVSGGTLGGTGTIAGPVTVSASGTLAPGAPAATGTLTINNSLSLAGNTAVALNGALSSKVVGLTGVSYGGTLSVTNLGPALSAGNNFTLFSAASPSGQFSHIVGNAGPGLGFAFNPATGVLSVVGTLPTTPTNITYTVGAGTITLSWPSSYTGWVLQAQTNNAGLGTNWVTVAGSASTNSITIPINTVNRSVFFRLAY